MRTCVSVWLVALVCAHASAQPSEPTEPTSAVAWIERGRSALARARYDDAQSDFERAAAMRDAPAASTALAASWADLGDALLLRGDPTRAVSTYARALLLVPGDASYHVARGWALAARGDGARARAEIAIARGLEPGSADARALERHLDEADSVRAALFGIGGVATGVGVLLALVSAVVGSLTPSLDSAAFAAMIASGSGLVVLGLVTVVLGDVLHVGSSELPRRGVQPTIAWLPGGGLVGLRTSF